MLRYSSILMLMLAVAGCSNFEPREKTAKYDPESKQLVMPYPCPDWSQSQTSNYLNQPHSNYGCAVNTNAALQLDDPRDLYRGHGDARPDTGITTRVIEQYRAGDLPVPLTPIQNNGS